MGGGIGGGCLPAPDENSAQLRKDVNELTERVKRIEKLLGMNECPEYRTDYHHNPQNVCIFDSSLKCGTSIGQLLQCKGKKIKVLK